MCVHERERISDMNYLEITIKEHLLNTDISTATTTQIAQEFYVSRAFVYKVINKLGYSSFESFKNAKEDFNNNQADIITKELRGFNHEFDDMVISIISARVVYVIAFDELQACGSYFSRQLINLRCLTININDVSTIASYDRLMKKNDIIIYLSSIGAVRELKALPRNCYARYYISPYNSELYKLEKNIIGYINSSNPLSNNFERDSLIAILEKIEVILNGVRLQKLKLEREMRKRNIYKPN